MSENPEQVIQIQAASNEAYFLEKDQAITLQVWHSADDRVRQCAQNYVGHIKTLLLLGAHAHRMSHEMPDLVDSQLSPVEAAAAQDLRADCVQMFGTHGDQHAGLLLISAAKMVATQQALIHKLEGILANV